MLKSTKKRELTNKKAIMYSCLDTSPFLLGFSNLVNLVLGTLVPSNFGTGDPKKWDRTKDIATLKASTQQQALVLYLKMFDD